MVDLFGTDLMPAAIVLVLVLLGLMKGTHLAFLSWPLHHCMYLVALAPMIRYLEPLHNPSLATRCLNVYCEIHLLPCIKYIIALFMHPS